MPSAWDSVDAESIDDDNVKSEPLEVSLPADGVLEEEALSLPDTEVV